MRLATAAAAALTTTLLLLPTSGTMAAWDDTAAVSSPGPLTALEMPPPMLTCTGSGSEAVISWPQAALPDPGSPAVGYSARVVETGMPLTVQGTKQKSVTVSPASTGGPGTWTVQVTASVMFELTTWTAAATQGVRVVGDVVRGRVFCA